jgi:hypothetical protein
MGDVEGDTAARAVAIVRRAFASRCETLVVARERFTTRVARGRRDIVTAAGVRIGEQDLVILNRIFDRAG